MTDNFNNIISLLTLEDEHDFYYIQLLARRKDNPELTSNAKFIYFYCYDKQTDWLNLQERIKRRCDQTGARAYISINKRNYQRVALESMKLLASYIADGHYPAVKSVFTRAAGSTNSAKEKRWVIDIDETENIENVYALINQITNDINQIEPINDNKIITWFYTKTGVHMITKPFNLKKFHELYPNLDVFKDSSSLLYAPNLEN